jgi:hypothetical protein
VLSSLRNGDSTARLSLGVAGLSLLILFPLNLLEARMNLATILVVGVFALGIAALSVCLGTYGIVRAHRWQSRSVNLLAVALGLLAMITWAGGVVFPLGSGCLGSPAKALGGAVRPGHSRSRRATPVLTNVIRRGDPA